MINNETMVTCDSGDWRHQSVYIPMLSCSGCLVIVVHCCMRENGSKFLQLTLVNLFQKKKVRGYYGKRPGLMFGCV